MGTGGTGTDHMISESGLVGWGVGLGGVGLWIGDRYQ
jgi:hypothetical protein